MVSEHKEEGKLETEIYDLKLHLQHVAQLLRTGRLRQVGLHVTLFRLPAGNPSSSNAPHHPPRRSRRDPGRMKRREREGKDCGVDVECSIMLLSRNASYTFLSNKSIPQILHRSCIALEETSI